MDVLWIIVTIGAITCVAVLAGLVSRAVGTSDRGAKTSQQRLDEAEMLTQSKRPF
jgi:hypothetical protein